MMLLRASAALGLLACAASAADDIGSYVQSRRQVSLQNVLNNIGINGSEAAGAAPGIVVASPSHVNPDYFHTWTRDSALTMWMILKEYVTGNTSLERYLQDYAKAQAAIQARTNPSGTLQPHGAGLGEPKFQVDGNPFNGPWGRPQRDGPALRAISLIGYAKVLASNMLGSREVESGKVKAKDLWSIIKNDLSYLGEYWNRTGFDPWEEVSGSNFFTTQVQYRALVEGADLAKVLNETCEACDQAPAVLCFLNSAYWNGAYFTANVNAQPNRTGLDATTILGPITVFDPSATCDSPTLQPCHSKSLANFKAFVDAYRNPVLYPINADGQAGSGSNISGVALGRYPEDTYFGGNMWYLVTHGAAEFLYDVVAQWQNHESITVDDISLSFFQQLYPGAAAGTTYKKDLQADPQVDPFAVLVNRTWTYANSFVAVAQKYTPANASLSEQFSKHDGTQTSARDLTWSYASFLTMAERRRGDFPAYWTQSASHASDVLSVCPSTSVPGVYAPAVAAGAPNITQTCETPVVFNVSATTYYGENIWVIGNVTELGSWDFNNAIPLSAAGYTAERPFWAGEVLMAPGDAVTFKYVRQQNCKQPLIYEEAERSFVVPPCVEQGHLVKAETQDKWIGDVGKPGKCSETG